MKGPFQIGDAIVCVAAEKRKHLIGKIGKVTRVCRAAVCERCDVSCGGIEVSGFPCLPHESGYCVTFFRHLPRATEEFTAQMRAIKPVKEPA